MKYPYIVNKNGVWYHAGAEVPEDSKISENKEEKNFLDEFAESMNPPVENTEVTYTKTEISRMSTAELKELATREGIDGADDITGAELKKVLIDKFGL